MSRFLTASVVYGSKRRPRPVRVRMWFAVLALSSVVGMVYLATAVGRDDVGEAVPLFRVNQPVHVAERVALPLPDPSVAVRTAGVKQISGTTPLTFNGMAVRPIGTRRMLVTAYCPCRKCCGRSADSKTASGYSVWVNGGKMVAADTRILPFGTIVSVPGYHDGELVPVLDRGGRIKGNRLDVLFPTHKQARKFGVRWLNVPVYEIVD